MASNSSSSMVNLNPLPQINGTDQNNVLFGSDKSEQIFGNGGNDLIFGGGGNDLIFGGTGDDIIYGGEGNDNLSGDEGNDLLIGGNGNDYLTGFGGGRDTLTGGAGGDTFALLDYVITDTPQSRDTLRGQIRGIKIVTDFTPSQDKIEIDYPIPGSIFDPVKDFKIVSSDRDAQFSSGKIVYNRSNGKLFLNNNGTAAGFNSTGANNSEFLGGQFAVLRGTPNFTAGDLSFPTGGDLAAI